MLLMHGVVLDACTSACGVLGWMLTWQLNTPLAISSQKRAECSMLLLTIATPSLPYGSRETRCRDEQGLADEAVLVVSGLCSSIPWPASLGGQRSAQADESIYAQT